MICMKYLPHTDFGVLRVKTDNHGNPHCHKQELKLVAGTLVSK